jgi:hypothetical protein
MVRGTHPFSYIKDFVSPFRKKVGHIFKIKKILFKIMENYVKLWIGNNEHVIYDDLG